jgi:phosphoribosylaminoimidazolecarboxamide formyltransferase/IMP cyclohydrolase
MGSVTVGIGGGLPNQLDALRIAVIKAGARCRGAVLASDASFPFADLVEEAARIGIRCIVQPGGSIRDQEVIGIADENELSMVFTGVRHLRH